MIVAVSNAVAQRYGERIVDNLRRLVAGRPLRNRVRLRDL